MKRHPDTILSKKVSWYCYGLCLSFRAHNCRFGGRHGDQVPQGAVASYDVADDLRIRRSNQSAAARRASGFGSKRHAGPHSYQTYTTSFVATAASTNISFAFREDPAFLLLDNVSVTTGGGSNLLTNGNFDAGVVGSSAPVGWTYLNIFGATFGGVVQAGCGTGGSNCYFDGAVQAYDSITQAIATTIGLTYNIAFDLSDNGGLITFSALSTNGDVTDIGGNGVNLLVYAGGLPTPATVPLPGALPLFATGLGALGLLGWRKRRKSAAVTAAA